MSPLSLSEQNFSKVHTVVDASLENSDTILAVRAQATNATVLLKGRDIFAYLNRLATKETPLHAFDLEAIKTEAPAAAPAAKKEKEDAKIEGAVQIAIGVKKEVDFATWYTNVRTLRFLLLLA